MIKRGIIVSIQGYHYKTIAELALEAISAGCVALRVDKKIDLPADKRVPIIGLRKVHVDNIKVEAFITPTVEDVELVKDWADLVAIDYRQCNAHLNAVSKYCREHKLSVVADVSTYEDFENIKTRGYYYAYVATTLASLNLLFRPNIRLVEKLGKEEKNLIAEGNFTSREDVRKALECGARAVCIGGAISNVYKLTKKFTSVVT